MRARLHLRYRAGSGLIAQRSLGLSDLVTIARFPGKHDLVLSDAPVREAVYATMRGWLEAFVD